MENTIGALVKLLIAKENPAPCAVSVTLSILACGTHLVMSIPFSDGSAVAQW